MISKKLGFGYKKSGCYVPSFRMENVFVCLYVCPTTPKPRISKMDARKQTVIDAGKIAR